MYEVLKTLLERPFNITSSRGTTSELIGQTLILENPRARLSRSESRGTVFSALGEFLWYMSGSNSLEFIEYYISRYKEESEDDKTIHGAYGPRLLSFRNEINQIENIIALLSKKPLTRRAVVQIFDASDLAQNHKEIPCTCTLQFFVRDEKVILQTYMRSNDAVFGLSHDIFAFTLIQEYIAARLSKDVGEYIHTVGSLHLYDDDPEKNIFPKTKAQEFISEGFQSTKHPMPSMPIVDVQGQLKSLLELEGIIRTGKNIDDVISNLDDYWADLARIIQIHAYFKKKNVESIGELSLKFIHSEYQEYVNKRLRNL